MNTHHALTLSRRKFLRNLTIVGGTGLLGIRPELAAAEPPPETTTIRLPQKGDGNESLCFTPSYLAETFLHMEGFTDVRYVPSGADWGNNVDIFACFAAEYIVAIDRGLPVVILGGSHVGCMEIFVNDRIRAIHELKNKRIAVGRLGGGDHAFLSTVVAHIGLDAQRDIEWVVVANRSDAALMLTAGEIDAIGTPPPWSYEFRERKIGRVMLNTTTDEPWHYYFCCVITAQREYVENYPIATKRALRALLKANQLCSLEPERTARFMVDRGYTPKYGYALQTLQDIPYSAWQDYDVEDTIRFYSLRLREAGMIESTPQEMIARGTDWRFLNAIKKELKA